MVAVAVSACDASVEFDDPLMACAAVVGSVGGEVAEELLAPALAGSCSAGDLGMGQVWNVRGSSRRAGLRRVLGPGRSSAAVGSTAKRPELVVGVALAQALIEAFALAHSRPLAAVDVMLR